MAPLPRLPGESTETWAGRCRAEWPGPTEEQRDREWEELHDQATADQDEQREATFRAMDRMQLQALVELVMSQTRGG